MKLSLVIPAYNEERLIRSTLENYVSYFNSKPFDFELIVIIDGKDKTGEIVEAFAKKNNKISYKIYNERLGKGGAVIEGFKFAKGSVVGFVDADQSTTPKAFYELLSHIRKYDIVIASRRIAGVNIIRNRPVLQRIGSEGFNLLVRMILGLSIKDTQCGAKLFRADVIKKFLSMELTKNDWGFDVELLYIAKKNEFSIKEVPTTWEHRVTNSKFNFSRNFYKIVPKMFISLFKIKKLHN